MLAIGCRDQNFNNHILEFSTDTTIGCVHFEETKKIICIGLWGQTEKILALIDETEEAAHYFSGAMGLLMQHSCAFLWSKIF